MVVVAFLIRDVGDDDVAADGGDDVVGTVVCPDELLEICRNIDSDVEVVTTPAGQTAGALLTASENDDLLAGEVWVIPAAWADLVTATRAFHDRGELFEVSDPIASTQVALAIYASVAADLDCEDVDWTCLADAIYRGDIAVGSPPVSSALGLPVAAAQLVQITGSAGFDPADARLPPFEREPSAFRNMRTQGQGKFAAVGTTTAEAGGVTTSPNGLAISVSPQPTDVRIDLVVVTRVGSTVPDDLRHAIAAAFFDAHWNEPGSGPSGMPDGDLLNVIRKP